MLIRERNLQTFKIELSNPAPVFSTDPYKNLVSLGKAAIQSSTEGNQVASLVTDANFKNEESDCAQTTVSDNPYLEVDLGKDYFTHLVALVLPATQPEYNNIKVTITSESDTLIF